MDDDETFDVQLARALDVVKVGINIVSVNYSMVKLVVLIEERVHRKLQFLTLTNFS